MQYTIRLALCLLFLGWILAPKSCFGFEVKEVSFAAAKIYNKRDSYLPRYTLLREGPASEDNTQTESWDYSLDLKLDTNLFKHGGVVGYWTQNIVGESTTRQYRRVHWDFEFGLNLFKNWDVFHHHKSEHALDVDAQKSYPLQDIYGIRLCFHGSACQR